MVLFARTRTGVELTKAGQLVFDEVQLRVRGLERLNGAIETIRSGRRGQIRLAAIPVLAEGSIGRLIGEYLCQNPGIHVELDLEHFNVMPQRIRAGEIELGFMFGPHPGLDDLTTVHLGERHLVAVTQAGSAWSGRRSWRFDEIGEIPIVQLRAPHPIRAAVENAFAQLGVSPVVACVVSSQLVAANIVASGVGIGFLDSETAGHLPHPERLSMAPIQPMTSWPVLAVHSEVLDEVPAAKRLLQFLQKQMQGPS